MVPHLIAALSACAQSPLRPRARRFLIGLSADELEFIATYLGSCILEPAVQSSRYRGELAMHPDNSRLSDRDHKLILLREFLKRSGLQRAAVN